MDAICLPEMPRRAFLASIAGGLVAAPLAADALLPLSDTICSREARNDATRFPALADELIRLKVDLILTRGTPAALAAKRATGSIPVVMAASGDPAGSHIVTSLARPGGMSLG
jgi:ABC-type uncharacterized transport system substrate-binding protein